jgi:hypothetical protein
MREGAGLVIVEMERWERVSIDEINSNGAILGEEWSEWGQKEQATHLHHEESVGGWTIKE